MKYITYTLLIILLTGIVFSQNNLEVLTTDTFNNTPIEDMGNMCSLGCAMNWGISATSILPASTKFSYTAENMKDYEIKTAWVEGKDDLGEGEKIIFTFSSNYFEEAGLPDSINLNGFRLINGYAKSTSIWKKNGRVKTLNMFYNDELVYVINVQDNMLIQEFRFPVIFIKKEDKIIFEIVEGIPGSKYNDVAITEFEPLGAH